MKRFATRSLPDKNQEAVIGWYEELYCSVIDLHGVGFGCPDLAVGFQRITELVEVKSEAGQLEASQVTFNKTWRGNKVVIVRTRADVINHVKNIMERSRHPWSSNGS